MEFSEYKQVKAINSSGLKLILRSPLHYWHEYLNPKREKRKVTPSLRMGSALHGLLLEQTVCFDVAPEGDKRKKEVKAIYEEWKKNLAPDTLILTTEELKKVEGMTLSFFDHEVAPKILFPDDALGVWTEHTLTWTHQNGLPCKARLDAIIATEKGVTIVDVKTCVNASEEEFSRAMFSNKYYLQAAFYREAIYNCMPELIKGDGKDVDYIFICIENAPPYAVTCYPLANWCIDAGDEEWMAAMDIYDQCILHNRWPGYKTDLDSWLDFPIWARRKLGLPLE